MYDVYTDFEAETEATEGFSPWHPVSEFFFDCHAVGDLATAKAVKTSFRQAVLSCLELS
jgi:hypothetical protein